MLRHRADRAINLAEVRELVGKVQVRVVRAGKVVTARSQDIAVGDIVMVR